MHNAMHVDIRKSHQTIYTITACWIPAVDQVLFYSPKRRSEQEGQGACLLRPTSNTWKRIDSPVPANCCTEQKTRRCDPELWRSRGWSAKVSDISDIWAETGGTPAGQLREDLLKGRSALREKQALGACGFKALTQSEKLVRWQGTSGAGPDSSHTAFGLWWGLWGLIH